MAAPAPFRAGRRVKWRSAVYNVAVVLWVCAVTLVTGPFIPFLSRPTVQAIASAWCRGNLWLLDRIVGVELEIRGREHIPHGGALVAAKHQSQLETFGLMPFLPDATFVLKRELTWLPFFGWFLMKLDFIAIDRSAGGEALTQILEQAEVAVRKGRQVVIYPEGTRKSVGDAPRYKQGVLHLYDRLGAPCVPVAMNTGVFWPKGTLERRQGRAVIEFLPAIAPGLPREAFQQELIARIEAASDALIREAQGSTDR